MTLLESLSLPLDTDIIDFNLPATDGKEYSPSDFADKKALVIVFMCNHCPYVLAVLDRLNAIQRDYGNRGIQIIGINSNDAEAYPDDSFENMQKMLSNKSVQFVYLHDEDQSVARLYKAQCTPDIYVYNSDRQLVYHGRIDDNWQNESIVQKHELRDVLNAILADQPVSEEQHPTIGCSIKWKTESV